MYAVGYEELSGQQADLVEVLNLDKKAANTREVIDDALLGGIRGKVRDAGDALRRNGLPRLPTWSKPCDRCDLAGICRDAPTGLRA